MQDCCGLVLNLMRVVELARFPASNRPMGFCGVPHESCMLLGTCMQRGLGRGLNRTSRSFSRFRHACGLQAIIQRLLAAREQFLFRNLAGIDVGQDRALGEYSLFSMPALLCSIRHALRRSTQKSTSCREIAR